MFCLLLSFSQGVKMQDLKMLGVQSSGGLWSKHCRLTRVSILSMGYSKKVSDFLFLWVCNYSGPPLLNPPTSILEHPLHAAPVYTEHSRTHVWDALISETVHVLGLFATYPILSKSEDDLGIHIQHPNL